VRVLSIDDSASIVCVGHVRGVTRVPSILIIVLAHRHATESILVRSLSLIERWLSVRLIKSSIVTLTIATLISLCNRSRSTRRVVLAKPVIVS
jgi:hypothetical protein